MYLNQEQFITRAEALAAFRQRWNPALPVEEIAIANAADRVLAQDVASVNTLPVCRSSMMDGIAVSFAELMQASGGAFPWTGVIAHACADTGDDFDDAFDTVLAVEETERHADGSLTIAPEAPIKQGQCIKLRGSTVRQGQALLDKNTRLQPIHLALLGTAGVCAASVYRKPIVAYLPTGNELIPIDTAPQRGQNIESNSLMVQAMLAQWGAQTCCYPIVKDDNAQMEAALLDACSKADVVLLNGGSSMGSEDYASRLLQKHAAWFQHGIRCIPGIPVAMAMIQGKPVINLPGPTLASYYAMDWCVKALVCHALGQQPPLRKTIEVQLEQRIQKPPHLEMYIRLHVEEADGRFAARVIDRRAGLVRLLTDCNALFIAPIGKGAFEADEIIRAELLDGFDF
ncbi:MAG: molybdopterin molybdotransferase MoeA [Christensenellaceae bacterium]|jgi:molybdopterin molybdotransferase/putative molybdopterin biosynthesis protein|nr:molybdopterin molybdotransferase MoeA [Christensenellaceae bacterium]